MALLPSQHTGRRRAPIADINVTPLVDVMLVLLIIFMVTAPLLTAGVPVDLPATRAKAIGQDQQPVAVSLRRDGTLFIDKDEVTEDEMPAALASIARRPTPDGKPPQVLFRADRGTDYDRVLGVLGEINRAGLGRLSLVSNPKAGS